jgi:hypothetical protein
MQKENESQGSWQDVVAEFQNKSDRAAAILGGAYLDSHLGRLIGSFIVEHPSSPSYLKSPHNLLDVDQPLGTFGPRIRAAYALGLISLNEYHDLHLIKEVQYMFANDVEGTAFSDDGIREKCFLLRIPREVLLPDETRIPRQLFVFATAILTQHLAWRAIQAEHDRRNVPDDFILVDVDE